jgi:serine protease Do
MMGGMVSRLWHRLMPLIAVLALAVPVLTAAPATAAPLDAAAVATQVEPTLVQVTTEADFQGVVGNGTGIVLTPDGLVMTSHHVIQGANRIRVRSMATGQIYPADAVGYDRVQDVAVIQVRGAPPLPVAPLGDSNSLALGDPVITIGNANGTGNPLTHEQGSVTSLSREVDAEDEMTGTKNTLHGLIESSTNLRSGDSGGALVDSAGRVVGLNAAATVNFRVDGEATPAGQGFAIPINRALDIANQIRAGVPSPSVHIGPSAILGVGISSSGNNGGLPVRSVLRNGPADQAGILPGDTLMTVDGVQIDSANALTGLLDQRYPGNVIDVNWIDQSGVARNAKVTLALGPVS